MKFTKTALIMILVTVISTLSVVSVIPSEAKAVDIDGDNTIGINDATEIQKFLARLIEPSDNFLELADADEDGKVSIDDATYIQKYISGLLNEELTEPTYEPSTEETTVSEPEPTSESVTEPTSESVTEPTTESVTEPATEIIYPTSLSINKTSITLGISEEFALVASCDVEGYKCTFSTENSLVAEVSDEGVISAVNEGTVKISCSTENGLTAACEVSVKPMATTISLNKTSLTLGIGEQFDLDSSIDSGTAAYHRYYYSDNPKVATAEKAGGLVTANSVGTANITVGMNNGVKAKCTITVKNAPDAVYLNKTELALYPGETFDLNSSLPSNTASYHIAYSSSDSSVASVKASGGIVTAKSVGKATVTAVTFNGKKVTCSVFVMPRSKYISNVPLVNQNNLPTGCETCSATMMLKFYGYSISETKFADNYLVQKNLTASNGILYGPDPNSAFIGSPYYSSGFGVYAPAMAKFMNNYFADNGSKHKAKLLEGKSLDMLCAQYVSNGQPVMVWATINMLGSYKTSSWVVNYADENAKYPKGSTYTWIANEHCLVLTGYDSDYYYFNDPWTNSKTKYSRSLVNTRYAELGKQAIAVTAN